MFIFLLGMTTSNMNQQMLRMMLLIMKLIVLQNHISHPHTILYHHGHVVIHSATTIWNVSGYCEDGHIYVSFSFSFFSLFLNCVFLVFVVIIIIIINKLVYYLVNTTNNDIEDSLFSSFFSLLFLGNKSSPPPRGVSRVTLTGLCRNNRHIPTMR